MKFMSVLQQLMGGGRDSGGGDLSVGRRFTRPPREIVPVGDEALFGDPVSEYDQAAGTTNSMDTRAAPQTSMQMMELMHMLRGGMGNSLAATPTPLPNPIEVGVPTGSGRFGYGNLERGRTPVRQGMGGMSALLSMLGRRGP